MSMNLYRESLGKESGIGDNANGKKEARAETPYICHWGSKQADFWDKPISFSRSRGMSAPSPYPC